ncbi:MAG: serine/threonine-protein kinase [Gammaproteobacteria bacterium]
MRGQFVDLGWTDGICQSCDAPVFVDERFCGTCGVLLVVAEASPSSSERRSRLSLLKIVPTEQCSQSGTDMGEGELYCANCGRHRAGAPDSSTYSGSRAADQARAAWTKILSELTAATKAEFRIIRELGRGGMAAVFLADELRLHRKVAIKVRSPALLTRPALLTSGIAIERFTHEAQTMAGLRHPNIVSIYSVRDTPHRYLVTQFEPGRPLDQVLKAVGQLPVAAVQLILFQVAAALAHAHRRGVIHRDVKPSNIMLDEDGNAMVTDFGIANVAENTGKRSTNTPISTVEYMSPEQVRARGVSGASDQYSLGIGAYELLTGRLAFQGDSTELMIA